MISISLGLACIGFILLSLSLKRHYLQVWPHGGNFGQWRLFNRIAGYGCIGLAALPAVSSHGLWIGLVLWISIWAAAAFIQTMLLTWWPRYSLLFGGGSVALVMLGLLL